MKTLRSLTPALVLLLVIITLWEILAYFQVLPVALFPPPSHLQQALLESPTEWWTALKETSLHATLGLLISLLLGSLCSLILSLSKNLKKAFLPFSLFFQTVPIIAIAPLLVIYFGFGAPTVVASAAIVSFFPVMASFLLGLETVEKEKLELFKLYETTKIQELLKLRLPNAFLSLYTGLKIAVGLAIIGAVAGEFVAGSGLGSLIDSSRTAQRVDRVFVALILLAGLGVLWLALLKWIFQCLRQIRPYGPDSREWS